MLQSVRKPLRRMVTAHSSRMWRRASALRDRSLEGLRHVLLVVAVACTADLFAQTSAIDAAFNQFWAAKNPREAQETVSCVLKSGVGFDEAYRRLRKGRPYTAQPTGQVRLANRTADGVEHNFVLNIPDGYDPARAYQVRFQLHGGVMMRTENRSVGP